MLANPENDPRNRQTRAIQLRLCITKTETLLQVHLQFTLIILTNVSMICSIAESLILPR